MPRFVRFIVRTDHRSRKRCTGVVASLRLLSESGRLPDYQKDHAEELFERINEGLPCPPFSEKNWDSDCISWFKDTPPAQDWILVFRDIIAILEDADLEVATLTTSRPGMIVYEDEFQVVAKSREY